MKRETLAVYSLGDMELRYEIDENQAVGIMVIPLRMKGAICESKKYKIEPLVQVKLLGDDYPFGFSQGRTMRNSQSTVLMRYKMQEVSKCEEETKIITMLLDERGYEYTHTLYYHEKYPVIEISVEVVNNSGRPVEIEMLSSFTLGGLVPFEETADPGQIMLHRMRSTWSAEGRVESLPVEAYQLEPSWQEYSANSIRYGQRGSMPVREFVPFAALEDCKSQVVWAVQLTHGSSWQIEMYRREEALALSGGLADMEFGQWSKILKPGEHFKAPSAIITAVSGEMEDAAARLVEGQKRHIAILPEERNMPVIFNEFCTSWGQPREEELIRMAEVLKGRGITYFVIDAGWYIEDAYMEAVGNWDAVGDWNISKSRFPHGIDTTVKTIKSCGMKPGIWFEFEVAGRGSQLFNKSEWLLKRKGYDIVSGNRKFLDFRNSEALEYISGRVIDFMQVHGFEYIKVDYNESIGIGCDGEESPGEELQKQINAVRGFFRKLKEAIPGLVIEICSSGGHRLVLDFLELGSMVSCSDAHECDELPIIAANMHRLIWPRQSQIWAVLQKDHSEEKLYYRITSAMLGRLCISGDIMGLSGPQWEIVQKGLDFYRRISHIIDEGISDFSGNPIDSYRAPKGWQAVTRTAKKECLTVVHSFERSPQEVVIKIPLGCEIVEWYGKGSLTVKVMHETLHIFGLYDFDGVAVWMKRKEETEY